MSDALSEKDRCRLALAQWIVRFVDHNRNAPKGLDDLVKDLSSLDHNATVERSANSFQDSIETLELDLYVLWKDAEIDTFIEERNLYGFVTSPWEGM